MGKVIIIDDDYISLYTTKITLESLGIEEVLTINNTEAAIYFLKANFKKGDVAFIELNPTKININKLLHVCADVLDFGILKGVCFVSENMNVKQKVFLVENNLRYIEKPLNKDKITSFLTENGVKINQLEFDYKEF